MSEVKIQNKIPRAVKIVLVGTTHPGNIGATARAMKTMGQAELRLVNPKRFPAAEATARAAGADDILANARVYTGLADAVANCDLVMAATARARNVAWPLLSPRAGAKRLGHGDHASAAIVFGRESSGLSNADLETCNALIRIPTSEDYHSLNLAAAVQLICYEIFVLPQQDGARVVEPDKADYVSQEKMRQFYTHLEQTMQATGYLDGQRPGRAPHRMRALFNRARLDESEWKILRGFLASIQKRDF